MNKHKHRDSKKDQTNNNNNNNNNNWESKDFEKTTKYRKLRLELTKRYPEYKVNQYNIIMDVLRGCSKEVEKNIKELVGDKCESIMRQMQKAILSSSLHIARMFKLSA